MEYTVEEVQKIFEKLIDDALAGKEVIIVETIRCRLVPFAPAQRTENPVKQISPSHENRARKTRKSPPASR